MQIHSQSESRFLKQFCENSIVTDLHDDKVRFLNLLLEITFFGGTRLFSSVVHLFFTIIWIIFH